MLRCTENKKRKRREEKGLTVTNIGEATVWNEVVDDELLVVSPIESTNANQIRVHQFSNKPNLVLEVLEPLHATLADSPNR